MTTTQEMQKALRDPHPGQGLYRVVKELHSSGHSKESLYAQLETLLAEIRAGEAGNGRESHEDAVLDVMDALAGWCHEAARVG